MPSERHDQHGRWVMARRAPGQLAAEMKRYAAAHRRDGHGLMAFWPQGNHAVGNLRVREGFGF